MELLYANFIDIPINPLLICPYCKNNIPLLLLKPSNGLMNINVQCSCLYNSKVVSLNEFIKQITTVQNTHVCTSHSKRTQKYCFECSKCICLECRPYYNFCSFTFFPIQKKCTQHKKYFFKYCLICHENLCIDCIEAHQSHNLITIYNANYKEPQTAAYNAVKIKNRKLTDALIERLEDNQMKNDIRSACDVNESINEDLILLHQMIHLTVLVFKFNPSYNLMQLQTIVANTQEYNEKELSIEEEYEYLMQHLQNNYILKHTPLYQCITFTTMSEGFGQITCLIQLNDGRLASSSHDQTIKLWNPTTYNCIATVQAHKNTINCLVELIDGRLVSGSRDSMKIWNTITLECIATVYDNCSRFKCIIQLNDGRLATNSGFNIKIWSMLTYQSIAILIGHQLSVKCLHTLQDGRLASGSMDSTIKLWNITRNYKSKATLTGHIYSVKCLLQLKDGRLVSSSSFNIIIFWNLITNHCIMAFSFQHIFNIRCMIQLNNDKLAFSCHEDIFIINVETNLKLNENLIGNNRKIGGLVQLTDGRLVSGSTNAIIIYKI